jgi:hypothetical protein
MSDWCRIGPPHHHRSPRTPPRWHGRPARRAARHVPGSPRGEPRYGGPVALLRRGAASAQRRAAPLPLRWLSWTQRAGGGRGSWRRRREDPSAGTALLVRLDAVPTPGPSRLDYLEPPDAI